MKKISKRIVFFGNERLATGVTTSTPTLKALIEDGYEIAAVITNYTEATSRTSRELEVATLAKAHDIPVIIPESLAASKKEIAALGVDCAVLVAFGKIVPQDIIDLFPLGIINVHPSLLPKHRGPTPIESIILEGATETGISIMQLAAAMDAGPVYAQETVTLSGTESKQELADTFGELGSKLIVRHLPAILEGTLKPTPQNHTQATYDSLITKLDGAIDWNMRAETIERQIRAYALWPNARTELLEKDVLILETEVMPLHGMPGEVVKQGKDLVVCAGDDALKVTLLKPAGKKEMTGQAFLAGYGKHLPA